MERIREEVEDGMTLLVPAMALFFAMGWCVAQGVYLSQNVTLIHAGYVALGLWLIQRDFTVLKEAVKAYDKKRHPPTD